MMPLSDFLLQLPNPDEDFALRRVNRIAPVGACAYFILVYHLPQELPVNVSTAMLQQGYKLIDRIPSFHITASTDVGGLAYMILDEGR